MEEAGHIERRPLGGAPVLLFGVEVGWHTHPHTHTHTYAVSSRGPDSFSRNEGLVSGYMLTEYEAAGHLA